MSTSIASAESSDRMLRTLAAVPVSSSILELGCGGGEHTESFLRLGFPVYACDPRPGAVRATRDRVRALVDDDTAENCVRPTTLDEIEELDSSFDWVIGSDPEAFLDADDDLPRLLEAARSVLVPGGWFYLTLPASSDLDASGSTNNRSSRGQENGWAADELNADRLNTSLVEARPPERVDENGTARLHAIYRRVEPSG